MITILGETVGTCDLCRKEGKEGVRCQVEGLGTLVLDWKCLQRLVSLKTGGAKPNGVPLETR